MDLSASGAVARADRRLRDHRAPADSRYEALWRELTDLEEFRADEMWRIERASSGSTTSASTSTSSTSSPTWAATRSASSPRSSTSATTPRAAGADRHDRRGQPGPAAAQRHGRPSPPTSTSAARTGTWSASRWMHEIFEPIMAMIPPDATGKLEPAEIFHEILEHRWYLSEQAGTRSTSSRPRATTSTASSPPSRTRRSRGEEPVASRLDRLPLADQPRSVGPQPHPLQPDRPAVARR